MLIAQISDLHILEDGRLLGGLVDTAAFLRQCVSALNRLDPRPDLVIASGDLVDEGSPAEYRTLAGILADLEIPFRPLPGNHDGRPALRQAFPDLPWASDPETQGEQAPLCYHMEEGGLDIICLDSSVPGKPHGALDPWQLHWLERTLDASAQGGPDRPCLLFVHHPPWSTGMKGMDRIGLIEGQEELAALVRRHPRIRRLCCGHVHRHAQLLWAGTLGVTAPSTAHQLVLDLGEDPVATLVYETPGFLLHQVLPDAPEGGDIITHYVPVQDNPRQVRYRDMRKVKD